MIAVAREIGRVRVFRSLHFNRIQPSMGPDPVTKLRAVHEGDVGLSQRWKSQKVMGCMLTLLSEA